MKQKLCSLLGYAILGLIQQQPKTGYTLRKIFATTPICHYSNSPGAIYPALQRLEEDGLIKGYVDQTTPLRLKRQFKITPKGIATLKSWLAKPLVQNDVVWHMDELMLRFAFMDSLLGHSDIIRFLHDFAREIEIHISGLIKYYKSNISAMPPYGHLAMRNGIEICKTHLRWSRQVLKEVIKKETE